MIVRIWKTEIDETRKSEYHRFEKIFSKPMFQNAEGCLGVLFAKVSGKFAAITFWRDEAAIKLLEKSSIYQETYQRYKDANLIKEGQTLEVFHPYEGFLKGIEDEIK